MSTTNLPYSSHFSPMFASHPYPSHLFPTTPPATTRFDKAAIVQETGLDGEFVTDSTCPPFQPCLIPPSMAPVTVHTRRPTTPLCSSKPLSLRPITDINPMPSFATHHASMGKRKVDMNMAATGSMAAQPGSLTPLASYAGGFTT